MEHSRERVTELGQQMSGAGGTDHWPVDLLLALDQLSPQPFAHMVGHFETVDGANVHWHGVACTENAVIEFGGLVGYEGRLQGDPSLVARRIADLQSLSVVELHQVDESIDFATRATLRLEFSHGAPVDITTIGVRNARQRQAIEAMVAYIRERAAIA